LRNLRIKIFIGGLIAFAAVTAIEIVAAINQPNIPFQNPSRLPVHLGHAGPTLTYLVLGDSTAAGQGATPGSGIADKTAGYLSLNHNVIFVNMAVSGARAADLVSDQVPSAVGIKPDLVLISIGANDATHLTPSSTFASQIEQAIGMLTALNPDVKIVVTGCPDMGSIPRFAEPLRTLAGMQGRRINGALGPLVTQYNLTNADIAGATGHQFRRDPTLFASDKFHPNDRGYALWTTVLDDALTKALPANLSGMRAPLRYSRRKMTPEQQRQIIIQKPEQKTD